MSRKFTSTFAVAAIVAFAFPHSGSAQTMVGDQVIDEAALPLVQHHCQDLAAASVDNEIVTGDTDSDVTTREDLAPLGDDATDATNATAIEEAEGLPAEARTREDLSPLGNGVASGDEVAAGDQARTRDDLAPLDTESGSPAAGAGGQPPMVDLSVLTAADCEAAGLLAD
jgi:hypothetical protein